MKNTEFEVIDLCVINCQGSSLVEKIYSRLCVFLMILDYISLFQDKSGEIAKSKEPRSHDKVETF